MRSDNRQLPCVQPPTSTYNFQLPLGLHGHGHHVPLGRHGHHGRHGHCGHVGHCGHGGHFVHGGRGEHGGNGQDRTGRIQANMVN